MKKSNRSQRTRCRIQIDLKPNELEMIECIARSNSKRASDFAKEALLETVLSRTMTNGEEKRDQLVDLISARFSKLEQILRFLVTNTSLARGYAMGVVETSNTEVAQTIQQRMIEARDYQRGLFFGIYPEQNETEPKENRG